jgi:prolyl-tRNA synthetase
VTRLSSLFIPTLRDDPADAEATSHKLLVRGGYIRQVGAGIWSYLPLGWKVHEKAAQIVREEQNAIGAQEMLMPVLTPAELWQATDRYGIPELFKLKDRADRDFVLPLTHEETVTFHARELSSYRQLPQMLYHFQTKERDEPRPRGGLLRVREFIMKDAYSFDRDEEGLDRSFQAQLGAYHRTFERCGLEFYAVDAEPGMMGGSASIDFLAPSGAGENVLVTCENGDFAADIEVARSVPRAPEFPDAFDAPAEIETPGVRTCEALAEFLGMDVAATTKAMPVTKQDGTVVLALLRGDDRLEEAKLLAALGAASRPSTDEEILKAFGAEGGSLGPVGFQGEVVADETLRDGQFVSGANRTGWHLRGVAAGRDYEPRFVDIRQPKEGDTCPNCGGALKFQTAIEVGHIFKLETRYSKPLDATFLDEDGTEKPLIMGSYGIGPGRIVAAAVEQRYGETGMIWPTELAPYGVEVIVIEAAGPEAVALGERLADEFEHGGADVLLDDRDRRPGEKFADSDLIGAPFRITVGKKALEDGRVDLLDRAAGTDERVAADEVAVRVQGG